MARSIAALAVLSLLFAGNAYAFTFGRDLSEKDLAAYGPHAVSGYTITARGVTDEIVYFQGDAKALNEFVAERAKAEAPKLSVLLGVQGVYSRSPWNDKPAVRADWSLSTKAGSQTSVTLYVYANGVKESELRLPENVDVRRPSAAKTKEAKPSDP